MPAATTRTSLGLESFFRWWLAELRDLAPGGDRRAGALRKPDVIVDIAADGYRLIEPVNGKLRIAGGQAGDRLDEPALRSILERLKTARAVTRVGLRLAYASCFARHVELPVVTAESHVERLLALDLERNSPFLPAEIRTAYCPDPARAATGKQMLLHLVVKRATVDGLIREIEELGLAVVRLDCWNEAGNAPLPVNFLATAGPQPGSSRLGRTAKLVLGASALALAGSAAYLVIDKHEAALRSLRAETAMAKTKVQATRDNLVKSQAQLAEVNALQRVRDEYVPRARLLDEMTRLLPDTAWVTDMRIDGGNVDITGLAASAANIVRALERSSTFAEATMTAPVMFDSREDKERFSIRVRLRQAALPAGGKPAEEKQ